MMRIGIADAYVLAGAALAALGLLWAFICHVQDEWRNLFPKRVNYPAADSPDATPYRRR